MEMRNPTELTTNEEAPSAVYSKSTAEHYGPLRDTHMCVFSTTICRCADRQPGGLTGKVCDLVLVAAAGSLTVQEVTHHVTEPEEGLAKDLAPNNHYNSSSIAARLINPRFQAQEDVERR